MKHEQDERNKEGEDMFYSDLDGKLRSLSVYPKYNGE
jgi:hypothetical protein